MIRPRICAGFLLAGVCCALAEGATIEKKYPDGKVKIKYAIDDQGDRDGSYEEFYANGKLKVKAAYKGDKLQGPFKSYHENGRAFVSAAYKNGQLNGSYSEESEQGLKLLSSTYKDGKLNGAFTRYNKGKPILTQVYRNGVPAHARSLEEIRKKLVEILELPPPANEIDGGLRRLKAYRYLVDVPYDNLVLDEQLNREAQAAARLCEKIGRIDHSPKNPGWPDAEFKLASSGCQHSSLASGSNMTIDHGIDLWMDDTGPTVESSDVGHRRGALNPALRKVGFGKSGLFVAMWTDDQSQPKVPDFDCVCFPPRGLMPVEFFGDNHAWSVSLHPKKYRPPDKSVTTKVYALDELLNRQGQPVKLDFSIVDNSPYGGLPGCVIFRLGKGSVAAGKRYQVEIDGLKRIDGKPPAPLSYLVEFVTLK